MNHGALQPQSPYGAIYLPVLALLCYSSVHNL